MFIIFEVFKEKPTIVLEAQKARFHPIFILQVLTFLAVFLISQLASSIPMIIIILTKTVRAVTSRMTIPHDSYDVSKAYSADLVSSLPLQLLYCTVIISAVAIIYCKFIDRRSLYSMGFVKSRAVKDYFQGLLIGFLIFSACVLIATITGTLVFKGMILGNSLGLLFAYFLGFVLQGMSEEVMLRGYFMISVAAKKSILLAVIANSVLFALMHIFNGGITVLALINLALFGIFASIYTLKANSIWGICAIHSVWNFTQGNIYGISVSGMKINASIFSFVPTNAGKLINGGSFGLEGGLSVTIVLLISIVVTMFVKGRSTTPKMTLSQQDSVTVQL